MVSSIGVADAILRVVENSRRRAPGGLRRRDMGDMLGGWLTTDCPGVLLKTVGIR